MYLNSITKIRASYTLADEQKNLNQQGRSMKVAEQREDLQFLAQILLENLRAEIPSGDLFQVKCAVKNEQLMILAQHPEYVRTDTEKIFAVFEEVFQTLQVQREQQVEVYLKVMDVKLPYFRHSLVLRAQGDQTRARETSGEIPSDVHIRDEYISEPLHLNSSFEAEHKPCEPLEIIPLSSSVIASSSAQPSKIFWMGLFVLFIAMLSGSAYVLIRPCVLSECKELQTSQTLQASFQQWKPGINLEQELAKRQQQLQQASESLKAIPPWAPHYQQGQQLVTDLTQQSEILQHILKALKIASTVTEQSQTPAKSVQELETRLHLWRQAITPLETLSSNSSLYRVLQPKIALYNSRLRATKQQLLVEEKWLKQLTTAKIKAAYAQKQQVSAQIPENWQEVQSTWQLAVNYLATIPHTSLSHKEAQELKEEYKTLLVLARVRATKELLAAKTYNQAVNAARQAKQYAQHNQWQAAAMYWHQALKAIKQVPDDSFYYRQAQALSEPYSVALNQAEEKLQTVNWLEKTRQDLDTTCSSNIRLCYYTIDIRGITVQMTPEYQQLLVNGQNVSTHLQALQQALEVISKNAELPLVIYNPEGQAIYSRMPGTHGRVFINSVGRQS